MGLFNNYILNSWKKTIQPLVISIKLLLDSSWGFLFFTSAGGPVLPAFLLLQKCYFHKLGEEVPGAVAGLSLGNKGSSLCPYRSV